MFKRYNLEDKEKVIELINMQQDLIDQEQFIIDQHRNITRRGLDQMQDLFYLNVGEEKARIYKNRVNALLAELREGSMEGRNDE